MLHDSHRNVEDRNSALGVALGTAAMRVAVNGRGDRVAIQRLFEPAASKKSIHFGRLSGDRLCDGRVVQQGNPLRGPEPS